MTDTKNDSETTQTTEEAHDGHGTLLARFAWAMVGPMLWAGALIFVGRGPGWFTLWEPAYLAAMAMMIWGRYAEQKSGKGTTLYGEPSTWDNFRGYCAKLLVLSSVCWGAAKLIGRNMNGW